MKRYEKICKSTIFLGDMVELVDTTDLKSVAIRGLEGSSPSVPIRGIRGLDDLKRRHSDSN